MKKLLAILLAAMMVFALAACGDNNTTDPDPDKDNSSISQSGENNNGESTDNSGESNNNGDSPSNGNEWPDDTFTTHVPKPSFALLGESPLLLLSPLLSVLSSLLFSPLCEMLELSLSGSLPISQATIESSINAASKIANIFFISSPLSVGVEILT